MAAPRAVGGGPSASPIPVPALGCGWVPQHHRDITLGRLDGFLAANQFADRNIRADLWSRRCGEAEGGIGLEVYSHPKDVPYPSYEDAVRMPYRPAHVGDTFGPSWTTHWFRVRARVPPDWDSLGPLMFRWDSGSEAMLYLDGPTPRQGITDQRNEYLLAEGAEGGQELVFYIEMAANGMFGNGSDIQPPDENRYFTLKAVELAIPHVDVTALFHDLRALVGLARELPPGNATGEAALYTANRIVNTYRAGDPAAVAACRALAASVLAVRDPGERLQVYAVGHCHIDTAWLWPFSETHRKTARSWSAQLRLAERFPWHVFTASSAQQYEWLLQDYPGLFAEIQQAADRGSFVPVGGTWVEMDTNLPSGESLVRQFLYGQRFFQSYFGQRCDVFWLPDTFGYSGQLPQIANGAGIRYFLTQKLSWNNINSFPHSTFYWAGLDGSQLLTHFPPANTYNAQADAKDILATATGSKDKDRAPAAYMLYGNGDGGGGPTVDMCESLARLAGCRGLASLRLAAPGAFFRQVEAVGRDLLAWRGELYFELHRGTYTSHAANKSDNRSCELLLREAEAAGALAAAVLPPEAYCYPRAELDAVWKDLLLFQFHDVLPGSAIGRVYDFTAQRYPQMKAAVRQIRDSALQALITAGVTPRPPVSPSSSSSVVQQQQQQQQGGQGQAEVKAEEGGLAVARGFAPTPSSITAGASPSGGSETSTSLRPFEVVGARSLPNSDLLRGELPEAASSAPAIAPIAASHTVGDGPAAWVFNSLALPRREVVSVPLESLHSSMSAAQVSYDGKTALVVVSTPPLSLTPVEPKDLERGAAGEEWIPDREAPGRAGGAGTSSGSSAGAAPREQRSTAAATLGGVVGGLPAAESDGGDGARGGGCSVEKRYTNDDVVYVMQNTLIRAMFNSRGQLISLFDLTWQRELVPQGATGNSFKLYEDMPLFWDAWDIEVYHLEKGGPAGRDLAPPQVTILEAGPLRCQLGLQAALTPTSTLKQSISMTAVSARLDFHCEVVWNENRRVLKVEFPWLLDAPNATYEVQYGTVERPTHTNTSWDWARFEVCAHKWADLSEPGYGVALLNDCKYGHATHGNVMRLTLLRSPKAPDALTDIGTHAFRFGLLPHAGGWAAAGVAAHGWAFNAPLRVLRPPPPPSPPVARGAAAGVGAPPVGALRSYAPCQPMFVVTSARPNPLLEAPAPPGALWPPTLVPPPLILDTIKLPEPPLEDRTLRHQHQRPPAAAPPQTERTDDPPPQRDGGQAQTYGSGTALAAAGGKRGHGGVSAGAADGRGGEPVGSAPPASALVLRLYEPHGARGMARLTWPSWLRVTHVVRCNLLEEDEEGDDGRQAGGCGSGGGGGGGGRGGDEEVETLRVRIGDAGGEVDVPYRPYKIITLKVYLEQ